MATSPKILSTHTQNTSTLDEKSTPVWPNTPNPLDSYYHDYRIYDQSGTPLFVSAAITRCSMRPGYSHETVLPNSCPHKTQLLYLELPVSYWDNPIFDEETGYYSYLHWNPNLDVKSLTGLNFKALTKHSVTSSPSRVFTARPSAIFGLCPSFTDYLVYPDGLDRTLPIFRPVDPGIATHLFVKIPWRPKSPTPKHVEIALRAPLSGLHYWCAINDYHRIGVDYWLVLLAEK